MVKVTSERLPDAQVLLNIEVEPEAVEKATERAYQSLVNRMNVPGFRRGKAPRYLIERMIGGPDALKQEGIERLIPEVYRQAVEESGVQPIDQPELDIVSTDPLVLKATVPVQPTVEIGDYTTIRRTSVPVDVPYERINETIERLREQQTQWEPVTRAARAGDRLVASVNGTVGAAPTLYDAAGQPLLQTEGRETLLDQKDIEIEIDPDSQAPVPGFHKELVGMTPSTEKRFTLSLPADWPNEAQRSQTVLFHVTAGEVKEAKVPSLDDDFAKSVGEYETLEALREDVRERLRQQLEHEAQHAFEDSVIQEAVSRSSIELPAALVRREAERLRRNFERNLARQRLSLDQYLSIVQKSPEELGEELRPEAEKNLRSYLVLREIGKAEGVEVTPSDIDEEIQRMAGLLGAAGENLDPTRAIEMLNQPERRQEIEGTLWERKVVARLLEIAQKPDAAAVESSATTEPDTDAEADADADAEAEAETEGMAEAPVTEENAAEDAPPRRDREPETA